MNASHLRLTNRPNSPAVLWVVGLTALPEVLFTLLGSDLFGQGTVRGNAMVYGAFWNGLLHGWEPIYPLQHNLMFLTYALLHGGLMHLIGNMMVVLSLGGVAVARVGQAGFVLLYTLSVIGGAAGFALLSSSNSPMVGASGAVFGLLGAWKYWEWQVRRARNMSQRPVWMSLAGLATINLVMWFALSGLLAWEAHLGGFVAGVLFAAVTTPTLRHRV
jgi:membrane associated rhomboid family serine protease